MAIIIGSTPTTWQRPSDWLEIDSLVTSSDTRWVGLMAVYDETVATNPQNYITFISTQPYTVNVDGVTTNYGTNVRAELQINWANISSSTTTTEGFRQTILQVYPQTPPWTGTFYCSYTRATLPTQAVSQLLDIKSSMPDIANYFQNAFNNVMTTHLKKSVHLHSVPASINARYQSTQVEQITDDFSDNTTLLNTFNFCSGRLDIPSFTTVATSFATFASYSNLKSVGNITADSCTATTNAFFGTKIETIGSITMDAAGASNSNFVASNSQLTSIGTVTMISASSLNSSFYDNPKLEELNIISGASLANIGAICIRNYRMHTLTISDCSGITTTTTFINNCVSLHTLTLTGITRGFTVPPCNMNEQSFIDLFNSLGTASGAQTIVITGNITLLASTLLIATGKGYTVTP